jgi:hypothetical protein
MLVESPGERNMRALAHFVSNGFEIVRARVCVCAPVKINNIKWCLGKFDLGLV